MVRFPVRAGLSLFCASGLAPGPTQRDIPWVHMNGIQGGSNMTGTICVYTSHSLSRSYLNHLVSSFLHTYSLCAQERLYLPIMHG
jgi:hypothetical protein